jgi:hypothetical protein
LPFANIYLERGSLRFARLAAAIVAETYAHALNVFGERDLVDFVALMAQHSRDDAALIGFDQCLPAGQEPLLPEH